MKATIIAVSLLIIIGVSFMSCASFGTRPDKEKKETFKSSNQYNAEEGRFINRNQKAMDEMKKRAFSWKLFKEFLSGGKDRVPSKKLPEMKPDLAKFMHPSDEMKVIWFGHSSFMLNMDGRTVLVDPVFGDAASPVSFMVKRFQKPVLDLKQLPKIDYIVISHDHYDHLDMPTIKFFKETKTHFVVPLGVGSHLKGWGIEESRITEKDWWQTASFEGIEFTATPAQHFSGRDGLHDNETLWASWVLKSDNHKVYFSGDSGYDIHFKEIGEKLGPFDVAFIENGQYNKQWEEVHMLPEQGVQAFKDLNAAKYVPVHWGMFELAMHTWYEPVEAVSKLAAKDGFDLVTPQIGQTLILNDSTQTTPWWRNEIELPAKKTKKELVYIK